jgi:hypothetical protein
MIKPRMAGSYRVDYVDNSASISLADVWLRNDMGPLR